MSLKKDFIARLVKARSALGWSQADLSKASGISATQLSRYEGGLSEPRPQALGKLSAALNVQFDWLAHGRGPIDGPNNESATPPGFNGIEMEFSEEELAPIQRYAQAKGLTVEMAVRQLALSALKEITLPQPGSSAEVSQEDFTNLKKVMDDFAKRLASLESSKTFDSK